MAEVELYRDEVTRGDLPMVCVCCGAPAAALYPVAMFGRKLGVVRAPLCQRHDDHWRWRTAVVYCCLGATVAGFLFGAWLTIMQIPDNWLVVYALCIMGLACLVLLNLIVYVVLGFTAVRVAESTATTVTLVDVAPEFVEAVHAHRKRPPLVLPPAADDPPAAPLVPIPTAATAGLFTDTVHRILELANQEANRLHQDHLGTALLLYGLSESGANLATHFLQHCGIDRDRLRFEVKRLALAAASVRLTESIPWTPAVMRVLAGAREEAGRASRTLADEGHLLLALLLEPEGDAVQVLVSLGADLDDLRQKAQWLLRTQEGVQSPRSEVFFG